MSESEHEPVEPVEPVAEEAQPVTARAVRPWEGADNPWEALYNWTNSEIGRLEGLISQKADAPPSASKDAGSDAT